MGRRTGGGVIRRSGMRRTLCERWRERQWSSGMATHVGGSKVKSYTVPGKALHDGFESRLNGLGSSSNPERGAIASTLG